MSALSHRDRKQNLATHSSLRALKFNMHRVLKAVGSTNQTHTYNDRQIAHQLMQEFGRIGQLLEECETRRKCCELPNQRNDPIQSIINLQRTLSAKDNDILSISEEIKALKSARGQEESSLKQQKQQQEVFQLASQLRNERMELVEALQEHSRQVKKYQQMRQIIKKAEQRYYQKFSQRIMSYQEFKIHQEQRREEEPKRQRTYIRAEISNIDPHKTEGPMKTMKQLQTKKTITEAAIKNSRRKHQAEINELRAKVQFLRDQDALIDEKVREVQSEKGVLQEKFKGSLRYIKSRSTNLKGSPSFLKSLPL